MFKVILQWVNKDLSSRKQHFPLLFKNARLQYIPIKYVAGTIRKNASLLIIIENIFCRTFLFLYHDKIFRRLNYTIVVFGPFGVISSLLLKQCISTTSSDGNVVNHSKFLLKVVSFIRLSLNYLCKTHILVFIKLNTITHTRMLEGMQIAYTGIMHYSRTLWNNYLYVGILNSIPERKSQQIQTLYHLWQSTKTL